MPKLLVVFGATGRQGGSVIRSVLDDSVLSRQYRIRAVTRDPSSTTAEALKNLNVEVVKADLGDPSSLPDTMEGGHTVFYMAGTMSGEDAATAELAQGKAATDAAVAAGVQYLIFSTLPSIKKLSGGKYTNVYTFDVKAEVEEYIRKQPIKSAFFSPGSFMQNLTDHMGPYPMGNGKYSLSWHISPQTTLPLIDVAEDSGKFIGAILAEPDKYEGQVLCAATALYSMTEIAEIMSKITGKTVKYQQIDKQTFLTFLPPGFGEMVVEMLSHHQDFGYYGPKIKELVAWAVEHAQGKPATLEEYLTRHPLNLK